jgi:hypothetical protein
MVIKKRFVILYPAQHNKGGDAAVTGEQFAELLRLVSEEYGRRSGEITVGLGMGAVIGAICAGVGCFFFLCIVAKAMEIKETQLAIRSLRKEQLSTASKERDDSDEQ